ncbi:selection and upkeep of intraepithelial T-cells protein 2-like isoform X9 [Thunnus albacares]|uniref:selection and upkeep of intraepithelial T-cells protein 2-like isoform X9 n=1 Tax=Thunnus albacares TaxID=8236 RepID=UPI001CF61453|nr:selection and upkeep of intraepithelial T-cells protein 2-like isoform X9 [Thunnus albacares]
MVQSSLSVKMMFNLQTSSTTMKLLLLVFPLLCFEVTFGDISEPDVIKVIVEEGSDVILPCSLSSKESIMFQLFVWTRDHQKTVFVHYPYFHNRYGYPTQDEEFIGRVSHFDDELKSGNASIIIRNTEVADSGDYTCDFPQLQPRQIFHIKLVVGGIFNDRTAENIPGAATKPYVKTLNQTQYWALLQCEVRGSFPKPKLHWQDSDGNILHAEEPKVTERGGRYDIILNITVTKTDNYRCVATQEEINHQIYSEIYMYIYGGVFKDRRAENIPGTAPKPSVTPLKQTKYWSLLQCEVRGALPKPKLHWQDSDGNILHAEEPKVTERRDRYNVILHINVTKTDNYRCVATQEKIKHQVDAEMYMFVFGGISKDNSVSGSCYQWMIPFIILSALCCYFICVLLALIWKGYITLHCKKDRGAAGPHNQQEAVQLNTRREAV